MATLNQRGLDIPEVWVPRLQRIIEQMIRDGIIEVTDGDGDDGGIQIVTVTDVQGLLPMAYLLDRTNHTGTQAISTVIGLTEALAAINGQIAELTNIVGGGDPNPVAPVNTVPPDISGTTALSGDLTLADPGTWTGTFTSQTQYWTADGQPFVPAQTGTTLAKNNNMAEKVINCWVIKWNGTVPGLPAKSDDITLVAVTPTHWAAAGVDLTVDSNITSVDIAADDDGEYLLFSEYYTLTAGGAVGNLRASIRSGSSWGTPSVIYSGPSGVTSITDDYFLWTAWDTIGEQIVIAALQAGVGPGIVEFWRRSETSNSFPSSFEGRFNSATATDIPLAGAMSGDGKTLVVVFGAPLNQMWTYEGPFAALFPTANTGVPLALVSPLTAGQSVQIKSDGLGVAVVSNGQVRFADRAAVNLAWSVRSDVPARAGSIIGIGLNAAFTRLAIAATEVEVYAGTPTAWTYEESIPNPGGGMTLFGKCLAWTEDGSKLTVVGKTTTNLTPGGATAGQKQDKIMGYNHS